MRLLCDLAEGCRERPRVRYFRASQARACASHFKSTTFPVAARGCKMPPSSSKKKKKKKSVAEHVEQQQLPKLPPSAPPPVQHGVVPPAALPPELHELFYLVAQPLSASLTLRQHHHHLLHLSAEFQRMRCAQLATEGR